MSPDEIAATYEVLAPMAGDYANANIERAGQAQASYGPLAEAAMGSSRTAGIGNYTYNRLARPAVDTMRDELIVQGYSDALNRQLSETLRQAQENYNRSSRRYSMKGSGSGGTSTDTANVGTGQTKIGGVIDDIVGGSGSNNPTVLYNSYMIIEPDGTSRTYNRPSNMDDQQWWDWTEMQRLKAESEGKTFKRVPSGQ